MNCASYRKHFRIVFPLVLIIAFTGCKSFPVTPSRAVVNTPNLNELVTCRVGETLVSRAEYEERDAIEIRSSIKVVTTMGNAITAEPGIFVAETKNSFGTVYSASQPITWAGIKGFGSIVIPNDPKKEARIYTQIGYEFHNAKLPKDFAFSRTTSRRLAVGGEKKLIYNGRNENKLKFTYRSRSSGDSNTSEQNAEYDLSLSPIIEWEGAQIAITEADDVRIVFRAVSYFR
ncbi:MAG: hypothetical protein JWM68_390 [Verrucomicrobiales bacterium]|nr:hypothetical protein [Verrucomicrobiales bacterium]